VLRRLARASILSVLVLLLAVSSAFAHECYNASRSAQGNTGAQHSDNWFNLTLEILYTQILPGETGIELSEDGLAWALQESANQGIPSGFVIRADKTIGVNGKGVTVPGFEKNGANGKGMDHAVDAYGDQIFGIFFAASQIP
jgi:hypothetical protein